MYIGSRLWYGSWPYFCVDLRCGERGGVVWVLVVGVGLLDFVREWVDFTWDFVNLEWDFVMIRWDRGIFRELKVVGNKGLFEGVSK